MIEDRRRHGSAAKQVDEQVDPASTRLAAMPYVPVSSRLYKWPSVIKTW